MIVSDYHVHSALSADSESPMEQQILGAIAKGIKVLCFTEHMDLDSPYPRIPDEEKLCFQFDEEAYHQTFTEMKKKYEGQIELHFGIEMGLNTKMEDEINAYMKNHPEYEFVIGSTHCDKDHDPYYPSFFDDVTAHEAISHWMQTTLNNVRAFSFYDTCAHLDYILRCAIAYEDDALLEQLQAEGKSYGTYCYEQNQEVIDEILRILIARGTALEVNTSAMFKAQGKEGLHVHRECNPCPAILKRYHELGGTKITIGSDAHISEAVAGCFAQTEEIIKAAGFDGYCIFKDRQEEKISF